MTNPSTVMESVLTYQCERLQDIIEEVRPLWIAHYEETEGYREQVLRPDEPQFFRIEDAGMWRQFTARDHGKLVGHLGYIVHQDRHNSTKCATEDFFYFLPSHRKGLNAVSFLRYVIQSLKMEGCEQIGMSSKLTHDIDVLLRRVGFQQVAKFYILK